MTRPRRSRADVITDNDDIDEFISLFESLPENKINIETPKEIFKLAFDKRAYQCISYLLKKEVTSSLEWEAYVKVAADRADGQMVLLLTNNNFEATAKHIFKAFLDQPDEKEKILYFLTLLRFMPFETVDKLIETSSNLNLFFLEEDIKMIHDVYSEAKRQYDEIGCYFSQYSKTSDLHSLQMLYNRNNLLDLKTICQRDIEYGKKRQKLVRGCSVLLESKDLEHVGNQNFECLPHATGGTRRAAVLLDRIAYWNFLDQQKKSDFDTIRPKGVYGVTVICGRYASARPLIEAVLKFSPQSQENFTWEAYERNKMGDHYEPKPVEIFRYDPSMAGYILDYKYNNTLLNRIKFFPQQESRWAHGKAPVETTWGNIEDLFEAAWSIDLRKPDEKATPAEQQSYKEKLTQFYSVAAELVWLIGNTQPLNRGSGTYAELMLAFICVHHHLQPPILKKEFPQLDVLDITFPLRDYKFFFPHFFEPSTIPEHLQFKDIAASEPVEMQMEHLYKKLNATVSEHYDQFGSRPL